MKAEELQLNDWVISDGEPHKVCVLRTLPEDHTIGCSGKYGAFFDNISKIKPILLTEDILEKNGFKLDGKYYVYDSCFSINYDDGLKECWLQIGNGYVLINYVHELQHCLRLCGLSYVADSLKI